MKTQDPTIAEVRKFIYEQMVRLSKGEISVNEGTTIAKLGHQIMEGYKTQVRLLEVVGLNSLSSKDISSLTWSMDEKHE